MKIYQYSRKALISLVLINSLLITTGCNRKSFYNQRAFSQKNRQDCPEFANKLSANSEYLGKVWNTTNNHNMIMSWSARSLKLPITKPFRSRKSPKFDNFGSIKPRKATSSNLDISLPKTLNEEQWYIEIAHIAIKRAEKKLAERAILQKVISQKNQSVMQDEIRKIVVKNGKLSLEYATDQYTIQNKFQEIAEQVLNEIDFVSDYANQYAETTAFRLVQSGIQNQVNMNEVHKTMLEEVEQKFYPRLEKWQKRKEVVFISGGITTAIISAAVDSTLLFKQIYSVFNFRFCVILLTLFKQSER
ncbi:hypothetical protein NUACC21_76180 [Scytonema sp. NUACC21]